MLIAPLGRNVGEIGINFTNIASLQDANNFVISFSTNMSSLAGRKNIFCRLTINEQMEIPMKKNQFLMFLTMPFCAVAQWCNYYPQKEIPMKKNQQIEKSVLFGFLFPMFLMFVTLPVCALAQNLIGVTAEVKTTEQTWNTYNKAGVLIEVTGESAGTLKLRINSSDSNIAKDFHPGNLQLEGVNVSNINHTNSVAGVLINNTGANSLSKLHIMTEDITLNGNAYELMGFGYTALTSQAFDGGTLTIDNVSVTNTGTNSWATGLYFMDSDIAGKVTAKNITVEGITATGFSSFDLLTGAEVKLLGDVKATGTDYGYGVYLNKIDKGTLTAKSITATGNDATGFNASTLVSGAYVSLGNIEVTAGNNADSTAYGLILSVPIEVVDSQGEFISPEASIDASELVTGAITVEGNTAVGFQALEKISNSAKVTLESVAVTGSTLGYGLDINSIDNNSILTVNKTITATGKDAYGFRSAGDGLVKGAEVKLLGDVKAGTDDSTWAYGVSLTKIDASKLTVEGTITATGNDAYGFRATNKAKNGGGLSDGAKVELLGGVTAGTADSSSTWAYGVYSHTINGSSTLTVGGTITATGNEARGFNTYSLSDGAEVTFDNVAVTGGTLGYGLDINSINNSAVTVNKDKTITATGNTAVGFRSIGTDGGGGLSNGATVKLLGNIEATGVNSGYGLSITKIDNASKLTVEGTITATGGNNDGNDAYGVNLNKIDNASILTVEGTIAATGYNAYGFRAAGEGNGLFGSAEVKLEGDVKAGTVDSNSKWAYGVYSHTIDASKLTVGGTITAIGDNARGFNTYSLSSGAKVTFDNVTVTGGALGYGLDINSINNSIVTVNENTTITATGKDAVGFRSAGDDSGLSNGATVELLGNIEATGSDSGSGFGLSITKIDASKLTVGGTIIAKGNKAYGFRSDEGSGLLNSAEVKLLGDVTAGTADSNSTWHTAFILTRLMPVH
jgi:hypothetical protein